MSTETTVVVTGAASGVGEATTRLLRERGHRVVGVDRVESPAADVSVTADLSTADGRRAALAQIEEALGDDPLNGVVPCAGLAGLIQKRQDYAGARAATVLCGANLTPQQIAEWLPD